MDEGSDGLSACIFLVLGGQGEYRLGEPQHLLCSAPNQGLAVKKLQVCVYLVTKKAYYGLIEPRNPYLANLRKAYYSTRK
jgi:hypothetical protein